MARVGLAVVLVIALMPMAWAQTLNYYGEITNINDPTVASHGFTQNSNAWDYCYTLDYSVSSLNKATWYIDVPFNPGTNYSLSWTGNKPWTYSYVSGQIVLTKTGGTTTGTMKFQFWDSVYAPKLANPVGTGGYPHWGTTDFTVSSHNDLYTSPEPGGFALGAIVLGLAGGLWRRKARK
jgi:hypothetical protein